MRVGEPSRTVRRAAMLRAAHQLFDTPKVLDDPLAVRIVGAGGERKLKENPKRYENRFDRALRAVLVARSRFCEDALAAAVARGVGQFVILGAGLDTVAYRSPLAARLKVFEVDFPATQAWKRARLKEAGIAIPPTLTFAPIDFNTETLGEGLKRAGVDLSAPVFFSWLGVIYYLTRETVLATFRFIAEELPAGSEIVCDYSDSPRFRSLPFRIAFGLLAWRVALLGEPWKCFFAPDDIGRELARLGFTGIEDLDGAAMNARYFAGRSDGLRTGGLIHLLSARVG